MKKEIITEEIFHVCKRASNFSKPYTWGEAKEMLKQKNIHLMDNDIVSIGFEAGWDEGDSARDDMFFVSVKRDREETDAELAARNLKIENLKEESKKKRHEQYLKLKKEFETPS